MKRTIAVVLILLALTSGCVIHANNLVETGNFLKVFLWAIAGLIFAATIHFYVLNKYGSAGKE